MSSKIYQLNMLGEEKKVDSYGGNIEKGVKRLFAERDLLRREITVLNAKLDILNEAFYRQQDRLNRICGAL